MTKINHSHNQNSIQNFKATQDSQLKAQPQAAQTSKTARSNEQISLESNDQTEFQAQPEPVTIDAEAIAENINVDDIDLDAFDFPDPVEGESLSPLVSNIIQIETGKSARARFVDQIVAKIKTKEDKFVYQSPRVVMNPTQRLAFALNELTAIKRFNGTDVNQLKNMLQRAGQTQLLNNLNENFVFNPDGLTLSKNLYLEGMKQHLINTFGQNSTQVNTFIEIVNAAQNDRADFLDEKDFQNLADIFDSDYINSGGQATLKKDFAFIFEPDFNQDNIQKFITSNPPPVEYVGQNTYGNRMNTRNIHNLGFGLDDNPQNPLNRYQESIQSIVNTLIPTPGTLPANNNLVTELLGNLRTIKSSFFDSLPPKKQKNLINSFGAPDEFSQLDLALLQQTIQQLKTPTGTNPYANFGINLDGQPKPTYQAY